MRTRTVLGAWLGAAGGWLLPALAEACAVCGAGGGSPEHDAIARGFYWGVLFLMAMPFAVAASIGGWLWYAHRRGRRPARETSARGLAWMEQGGGE